MDLETSVAISRCVAKAIEQGLVRSCHDCSEGGLAVALAEMAFAGGLGIEADLRGLAVSEDCIKTDMMLFSESNSRYLIEVQPENYDTFAKLMLNLPFGQIGEVIEDGKLLIHDVQQKAVIDADLKTLKQAWQKPLAW
jgi:phosphoribosylformylglycinamidine synthase